MLWVDSDKSKYHMTTSQTYEFLLLQKQTHVRTQMEMQMTTPTTTAITISTRLLSETDGMSTTWTVGGASELPAVLVLGVATF